MGGIVTHDEIVDAYIAIEDADPGAILELIAPGADFEGPAIRGSLTTYGWSVGEHARHDVGCRKPHCLITGSIRVQIITRRALAVRQIRSTKHTGEGIGYRRCEIDRPVEETARQDVGVDLLARRISRKAAEI